jgi:hypothetical protein
MKLGKIPLARQEENAAVCGKIVSVRRIASLTAMF